MTDVSDRYRKLSTAFLEKVREVPPDAWGNPSPCEGWTALDVVRHVAETGTWLVEQAGGGSLTAPSVDDDPVGAVEAVTVAVQAALDDPEMAQRTHETPMGESTLEQTVGTFGLGDLLVHAWDLARATGLDYTIDADEAQLMLDRMSPLGDRVRSRGVFGPAVEVPENADVSARLLGFTGRDPS